MDASLSKSKSCLPWAGIIENLYKSDWKARFILVVSLGTIPMLLSFALGSKRYFGLVIPKESDDKSPIRIDPMVEIAGLDPIPFDQFLPAWNSAALVIGKLLILACFLSGTPSLSRSLFNAIVSKLVGIPSSSGLSAILITTL